MDLEESSATAAAQALGTQEARIAKTMSFLLDDKPLIIVVAGDARVDNHKFKMSFHKKAKMIPGADCEKYIGQRPGGWRVFCSAALAVCVPSACRRACLSIWMCP